MADLVQEEGPLLPVTALAFVNLDRLYLLSGEGEYLKIFHHESQKLLYTERVFKSQAAHGIACQKYSDAEGNQGLLLIWGGRSVCVLGFRTYRTVNDEVQITVTEHVQETQLNDWILDGCFQDQALYDADPKETRFDALLVTAHNELHMLSIDVRMLNAEAVGISCRIASGPGSILYSAHVSWPIDSRILVAAGTVFGEVLLWSYQTGGIDADGIGLLCHKFVGHEGSVFDVRISELQQSDTKNGIEQRVLATCSDDRTIRIWDITGTNNPDGKMVSGMDKVGSEGGLSNETSLTTSTGCLAMVMGHASRIWGLRFFGQRDGSWGIISHGEDGTSQVWRLSSEALRNKLNQARSTPILALEHQATYSYHSRKNVWGITEHLEPSNVAIIATGGADGRIATYKLNCQGSDVSSNQCDMIEASRISALTSQNPLSVPTGQTRTITRRIFDGLQGRWKLTRRIQSRNSAYPSGVLEGTATFESRCPSDEASSAEYLYSENGEFATRDGLAMKATRKYVYRYNENQDKITVWFVKVDDDSTVDYLFHDLNFRDHVDGRHPRADEDTGTALSANGQHLCDKDNYTVEYGFVLSGSTPEDWTLSFNVQGPKKDYTTSATYTYENRRNSPRPAELINSTVQRSDSSTTRTERSKTKKTFQPRSDSFKIYAWLSGKEFLTSTGQGNLLIGTMNTRRKPEEGITITWQHVSQQPLLRSSCIATSIASLGICCLTGLDGTILLYEHSRMNIEAMHSLHGKAGFLKAHRLSRGWNYVLPRASEQTVIGVFATCLGYSVAALLFLYSGRESSVLSVEKECSLELPANFTVTTSCFLDKETLIIIGSRSGGLAIYSLTKSLVNSTGHTIPQCFPNVHGQDTVTAIETVPKSLSAYRSYILTAGRNGSYGIHQVISDELQGSGVPMSLQTLHTGVPPFGPNIEGICIDADNLYIWGFRGTDFVVWNETEKTETMTVKCGGAHRNWAYQHQRDGRGGGSLVYTKASVCHLHSQKQAFHQVMQQGGHGREIKALALSSPSKDDGRELRLLATGAEDTTIRIFDARSSVKGFRCLSIITKHTTGLQKLQWSPDGRLLFSAAGCEEFFVWRLQPAPLITVGIVCDAQCPRVTEEADLRIMDFAVLTIQPETIGSKDSDQDGFEYLITMVYSDSSIRVFNYSTDTKTFTLITSGTYTTYCLTLAAYIYFAGKLYICTTSTDGHLAFWPVHMKIDAAEISEDPINVNPLLPPNPTTITHTERIRIHQNSIKSILTLPISQNQNLIITAGDDGALAFTHLHYPLEKPAAHSILLLPKAHASAITALAHLGQLSAGKDRSYRFASVGNDQRLKTWVITVNLAKQGSEGLRVMKAKNMSTSIADASSLDVGVDFGGERRLYVAGIGMERWRVGDEGIWWEGGWVEQGRVSEPHNY